jgi:Peptidase propeptide and YPEB domain
MIAAPPASRSHAPTPNRPPAPKAYETKARRGVWKFEGLDAQGRKLEISVDGVTGDVVKRETYGTGSRRSRSGSDS